MMEQYPSLAREYNRKFSHTYMNRGREKHVRGGPHKGVVEKVLRCIGRRGADMNATTAVSRPCYSGIYGTCHKCDAAGSCICGKWTSGHSDMITMDQTRWGGIVYVCHTFDIVLTIIWAVATVLACFTSYVCISGLRTRVKEALKKAQHPLGDRVVRIFGLLGASSLCLLGLGVMKLAAAPSLVGIDFAPSLFFFLHTLFGLSVSALHAIHMTEGALSTQESTLGRTRIQEAVAREAQYTMLVIGVCLPLTAAPMLGSIAELAGQHSETLELIQLLVYNGGVVVALVLLMLSLWFGSRRIIESFAQSITALKASLAIAGGGVSAVAEQARGAYGTTDGTQCRPAHLKVIDDELEKMEAMQSKIRSSIRRINMGGSFITLVTIACSCVPYIWNKFSYMFAMNLAIGQITYTYQIAASYAPAKARKNTTRPTATPAANPRSDLMSVQCI